LSAPDEAWQRSLGKEAEEELLELRNFGIGQRAPDIEAEDLNGIAFK